MIIKRQNRRRNVMLPRYKIA
ncbi:hypothetical protein [Hyphococcus sp. DH-69]